MKKIFMVFALVSGFALVANNESSYVAQAKDKAVVAKAYVSDKAQVLATKLYPTTAIAKFQEQAASNPVRTLLVVAASVIVLEKVASYVCSKTTKTEEELV